MAELKNKKLRIAIITRFGMPLTSEAYGYYYRLHYLADGLIKRGHQVTVLAHPETKTKAKLIVARAEKMGMSWEKQLITYANFLKKYADQFDIINAQTDHLCCFFAPFIKTPILHTIFFASFWEEVKEVLKISKNQYFSANSFATKKSYPYLNWQGIVYNGVNLKDFTFNNKPRDYILFLSRVERLKGVEEAINIAKKTGDKLIIAGQAGKKYFKEIIKPQLNKKIIYFGIANFKQKINLLKNAKALLHPHLIQESCSNAMLEAMACGTPVIAFPHGSPNELIKDNKTGFIVKNEKEMIKAIKNIGQIDRLTCRKRMEKYFNIERTIDGYEKIYQKIVNYEKFKNKTKNFINS